MPLALGHAGDLEWEGDVIDDIAPRERGLFLEHHTDGRVRAGDFFAGDRDLAVIATEQPADNVEQG